MKNSLKELEKEFHDTYSLLARSNSWDRTWDAFLKSCLLLIFSFDKQEWRDELKQSFSQTDRESLGRMAIIWVQVMDIKIVTDNDWYDFFGSFWEENILGKWERSSGGIFFTPEPICQLMATTMGADPEQTGKGLKINDPTCGSGRLLLAYNSITPGNIHYAQDINFACCLMTLCNFLIHGMTAEIIHQDTLAMKFYNGWNIDWNRFTKEGKSPITELAEDETMQARYEQHQMLIRLISSNGKSLETSKEKLYDSSVDQQGQYHIF